MFLGAKRIDRPYDAKDLNPYRTREDYDEWSHAERQLESNLRTLGLNMLLQAVAAPKFENPRNVYKLEYAALSNRGGGYSSVLAILPGYQSHTSQITELEACKAINPKEFANYEQEIDALNNKKAEKLQGVDSQSDKYQEILRDHRRQHLSIKRELINTCGTDAVAEWIKNKKKEQKDVWSTPIAHLLDEADIHYTLSDGAHHALYIDPEQENLDAKISQLMDNHCAEILAAYKKVDYIITKPNGEALDKQQAASIIAQRINAMREQIAQLESIADKHGVSQTVNALTSPRTGFGGRARAAEGDEASGDRPAPQALSTHPHSL